MQLVLRRIWGKLPEPVKLGSAYRRTARLLKETESWSQESWENYRLAQLKATLTYAAEHVPHYREQFRNLGFTPGDLADCADLASLPLTDKHEMRAAPERFTAQGVDRSRWMPFATGGTTGRPHAFWYPRPLYNREYAFVHRIWSRVGYRPGERLIILRGQPLQEKSRFVFNPRWNARVFSVQHLTSRNVAAYQEDMARFGARYLLGYPSSALWFYRLLAEQNLPPPPFKALLLSSENIYPHDREFLEQTGKTRVFSWYGHTERLILAAECEKTALYHEEPAYGYTELVDEEGRLITEPGVTGEMIGTSFANSAFPFVRYRTGDWAQWRAEPCACARPHRLLTRLAGRLGTEYLVGCGGSRISVSTLNLHGDEYRNIRQIQYAQGEAGFATVRIVPAPRFAGGDRARLVAALATITGPKIEWSAEIVERIALTPGGKHQIVDHGSAHQREHSA